MIGRRALAGWALLCLAALAGCSSDRPKPTALETFTPRIAGRQVWSSSVGTIDFPLGIVARGGQFIAAGSNGTVLALDAETGAEAWRAQAGAALTAGVGSDGRFTSVVTRNNEVVTLEGSQVRWKQRVSARVVTPPLVAGERVRIGKRLANDKEKRPNHQNTNKSKKCYSEYFFHGRSIYVFKLWLVGFR